MLALTLALALPSAAAGDARWPGFCDASAVAATPDGATLVANDEDDTLYRYDATGQLAGSVALGPALGLAGAELDLEGAATAPGGGSWWIGSLGRDKDGDPRPERRLLILLREDLTVAGSIDLLPALLAVPEAGPALAAAEPLPPKRGGINVEGLAADTTGRLWLGLRSPLDERGRALLVRLENPEQVLSGAAPSFSALAWLDLGGRGVRAMEFSGEELLLVAGPSAGDGDFALYRWGGVGSPLVQLKANLSGLHPEALLLTERGLLLLSDDGTEPRAGGRCKALWKEQSAHPEVYFRARILEEGELLQQVQAD